MGLFDEIKSQVRAALGGSAGGQEAASSDIVGHVTEFLRQHGLGNLLQQFQEKGMGKVVSSWVGKEANQPISVEQLQHALGPDAIANFAAKFGIPPGADGGPARPHPAARGGPDDPERVGRRGGGRGRAGE